MQLFDADETFNDDYLWFYEPTFSPERNRQEASEIVEALRLAPGSSILDAPCGHGRIANLLASEGFSVTGIDSVPLFLERAENDASRMGVDVEYVQGDLRNLPVSEPFDAVVCWFTSFGYFDDADNRRVLDQFARVLKPSGTLLIETMNRDGFMRGFTAAPAAFLTERDDDVMSDVTTFNAITGCIETSRTVRRDGSIRRSQHSVRLPTVPEFDEWLRAAGFGNCSYHSRGGRPLRFDSWRIVVTANRQ